MRKTGLTLTALAIAGWLYTTLVVLTGSPMAKHESTAWAGAITAVASFGSLFLAIYHWGTRYPAGRGKLWWGIGTILGTFIGAWLYWLIGSAKGIKPASI